MTGLFSVSNLAKNIDLCLIYVYPSTNAQGFTNEFTSVGEKELLGFYHRLTFWRHVVLMQ